MSEEWTVQELWRFLVTKHLGNREWNELFLKLLDEKPVNRSKLLTVANAPTNSGNGPQGFEPKVGAALYSISPDIAMSLADHYRADWGLNYEEVFELAVKNDDKTFVDLLSSKLLHVPPRRNLADRTKFVRYYEQLSPEEFGIRAVDVLAQLPLQALSYRPGELLRLFTDPEKLGNAPIAPLLESEHHVVRFVALKILQNNSALAKTYFRYLRGEMLRRNPRQSYLVAIRTLVQCSQDGLASECLDVLRMALELRQRRFPKDRIIHAIGEILHRFPEFRTETEHSTVFRRQA